MIECIIFDIDGTLIDTEYVVKKSLQRILQEEGIREYSWNEMDFILGVPGKNSLKRMGIKNITEVNERWNRYMIEFKDKVSVYEGIESVLQELKKRNIITGLVTSKTYTEFHDDFEPFGLTHYFDYRVCANDTARHKPFPDPLLKFLEISGANANQTIYIGDTIYDQQAATAAGIPFGLALWGTKTPDLSCKIRLEKPSDILKGCLDLI